MRNIGVRDVLISLGAPPFISEMSIPFVWFRPGETDPDSQPVIQIVSCVQRGLARAGKKVDASGVYDMPTARAVADLGLDPLQSTWISILCRVLAAARHPDWEFSGVSYTKVPKTPLGSYFEYVGPPSGGLPGPLPGPLGLGATASDSGVELEFGLGVRDKSNVVPVPLSAGPAFSAFRELQKQVNRWLARAGTSPIGEDGIVGETTRAGLKKALDALNAGRTALQGDLVLPTANTVQIASNAVTIARELREAADAAGVPARAAAPAPPPLSRPEVVAPAPLTVQQAGDIAARGGGLPVKWLAFLGVAAGAAAVATYLRGKRKKKGRE